VIARLNPIIRGWAAYYRTVVSSDAFTVLDRYLWRLTYKWAKHGQAQYWADRRRRGVPPPLDQLSLRLLKTQAGRCPCCGDLLLHAEHPPQTPSEWEQWVRVTGKALRKQSLTYRRRDRSGETSSLRLIHARCREGHAAATPA
jgi:Group II intron, maturase-specific domain